MSAPHAITADAFEILVHRELRKAGIEPARLQRRDWTPAGTTFRFDLIGLVSAYDHRWRVLIECRNRSEPLQAAEIDATRHRAHAAGASSALVFATSEIGTDALPRAAALRIAVLRVVDAQRALAAAGLVAGSQIPAWVPEFIAQLVWQEGAAVHTCLLQANEPEPVLRLLRV